MINFELDEEQKLIRETVIGFARDEIRPYASFELTLPSSSISERTFSRSQSVT